MTWFRIIFASALTFVLLAVPNVQAESQDDATIELHWRDCATIPADDTSWFDHCHDGPWRASELGDRPATFVQAESGESFTGEIDGNGDMTISVPAGTYTFQHPPFHDAEANDFICSYADETGNPGQPMEDPTNISLQSGEHVVCDFYVVWGGGRAGVEPVQPEDPQGIIEIRWRACEEASATDEDWFEDCFDQENDYGTEPQENRRITVNNAEDNMPWSDLLDEDGNVQLTVPPGSYTIPTMEGDFVTADFLFCSEANEAGLAKDMDIPTDPLEIAEDMNVICDYYYVAE